MPRHINNKDAAKASAVYEDGDKVKPIASCGNSFDNVMTCLHELTEKVEKSGDSAEIIAVCSGIVESMNIYHMTVIEEMAKIDVNPVVDMGKLDSINDRLLTIIQTLAMRKPKEWDFEIKRDMMGEITNVNAKEVMH